MKAEEEEEEEKEEEGEACRMWPHGHDPPPHLRRKGNEGPHVGGGREEVYGGFRQLMSSSSSSSSSGGPTVPSFPSSSSSPSPSSVGSPGQQQQQQPFLFCPWDGHKFVRGEDVCPECSLPRGSADLAGRGRAPWRKILYEEQPYEDNYTHKPTFLIGLITNANKREYDTVTLIIDSAAVTAQISIIALFIIVFIGIYSEVLSTDVTLAGEALLLVAGFLLRRFIDPQFKEKYLLRGVRSIIVLVCTLFGLSPVLKTLVESVSNDTIWALTIFFFVLHLACADYSYIQGNSDKLSAPVSLNAAIFASVLLGSRLAASMQVFALLCFAVLIFALFPIIRHHVKRKSLRGHLWLTWSLVIGVAVSLFQIYTVVAYVYIVAIVFTTFICPLWLKWMQRYKFEINGPWDEAVPAEGRPDTD